MDSAKFTIPADKETEKKEEGKSFLPGFEILILIGGNIIGLIILTREKKIRI